MGKEIAWIVNEHGCWICTSHRKDSHGYPQKMENNKRLFVSHIMYEKYKGPIPEGMCVLHNCPGGDNRACINPDHLWPGTIGDNNCDKVKKGRQSRMIGEDNGNSKLTEQQVLEIRKAIGTLKEIGKRYGISHTHVCLIKNYKAWKLVA